MSWKGANVVGASGDRGKYSNKAVRAYSRQGWEVYPVNPKGGAIEGLRVYASVEDIPVKIDRVTFYLPPATGVEVLLAIAALKPADFSVNCHLSLKTGHELSVQNRPFP